MLVNCVCNEDIEFTDENLTYDEIEKIHNLWFSIVYDYIVVRAVCCVKCHSVVRLNRITASVQQMMLHRQPVDYT